MPAAPPASEHKKPAAANDSAKKPADSAGKKAGPATDKDAAKGTAKGAVKGSEGGKAASEGKAATGAGKAAAGGGQKEAAAGVSGQRFDRMAVRAKLAVSEPGDAVEREADQIAERISRKPDVQGGAGRAAATPNEAGTAKNVTKVPVTTSTPPVGQPIARAAAPQATESPDGPVTKDNSSDRAEAGHAVHDADTQTRIKQQIGQGEQMAEDVRVRMEREFGHDFSRVRIHQDASANELCSSLGALAFTTGCDIFFATGRYQPGSQAGVALLAHELAHIIQQQDSIPTIARKIDPDMPAKYKEKNAAASATALADLGKLEIPAVKSRHLPLYSSKLNGNLKRKRGYDRGSPNQVDKWNKGVQIDEAKIRSRLQAKGLTNVPTDAGESFKLVLGNKKKPQSKSITQLQKLLKIPTWSRHGKALGFGFQVDHIIELQVSGENGEGTGNSLENMELLDQPSNSSSGGAIRSRIYTKVDAYLKTFTPAPKRRTFLKAHDIVFESVQANLQSGASAAGSSWWTLKEIQDVVPLDQVTPAPPVDEEGTATEFLLLSGPGGVVTQRIAHPAGAGTFQIKGTATGSISGLTIDSVTINDKAATGAGNVGSVSGAWKLPKKWTPTDPKVTLTLSGDGKHRGYPSKVGKTKLEFAELSPVDLDDISIDEGKVSAEGALTPSLPFLKAPINVTLDGDDVRFSMDYSPGQLALSAPGVSIDDAMISVFYSTTKGFGVSGALDFSVDKVGGGELRASFSEGKGVAVEGQFDFDSDLFDVAKVNAWWQKEGGFGASGDLAITKPGKIKGLKSANLKAKYEKDVFTAAGTAETDIPGVKSFNADVKFVDEENFTVTGSGELEKFPGIKSGSLTMTVERVGNAWLLSGTGNAKPDLPGIKMDVAVEYKKGIFKGEVKVPFEYGDRFKGSVTVGVTNGTVSADGKLQGSNDATGKTLSVYGEGNVLATLTDKLQGDIGVKIKPAGDLIIDGKVGIAKAVTVFDRYPESKKPIDLLPIPTVSIPLIGLAIGGKTVGVALEIGGRVSGYAYVGPGQFTEASIGIKNFNPRQPDTLHAVGHAKFEVPAAAGVEAAINAGVALGAAVIKAEAKLEASAAAEVATKPGTGAALDLDWTPAAGLKLQANLDAALQAKLKLKLGGYAQVMADVYVRKYELWRKDWTIAEKEFGSGLTLGISVPVGYSSLTNKVDFDPSKIKYQVPTLDKTVFDQVFNKEGSDQAIIPPPALNDAEGGVCEMPGDRTPNASVMPPQQSSMPPASPSSTQVNPKREQTADTGAAPTSVDENIVGRLGIGAPLDLATRGYFEQRMKVDLSRVEIHTSPGAAREADKLSARAFTVGDHIAFAQGEFQPNTPEGQELIAHELAHIAQMQGGGQPIILRWPAVTRTDARTSETPASIRAMTLSEFSLLTEFQLDWATSPDLQADAAALTAFRDIDRFTERPNVADGAGDLNVGDVIAKGIPAIYAPLEKYAEGAATRNTAWLRSTNDINKAESWGRDLTTLEAAWSAANLSLVMRAPPDPAATAAPFEKLVDPARPELANFISYLTTCAPVLSANDGSEVDSFIALRGEGVLPHSYHGRINYAKTYHHFTKNTLDGLVSNEAFPQWKQEWSWLQRPLTVVLYPAIDDNHAFHRNAGLETMVTNDDILTIVIEGHATVGDYQSLLAPVAARYGINGEIYQAMVGGHGNSTVLNLAGSANAAVTVDALGTSGTGGANTTGLMTELTRLMSASPAQRRIVLDACLTDSHHVASALRASPADAAADVNAAIAANPSLRDVVAGIAGAGSTVLGADASFAPSATTFMTPGSIDIGLSVPGDPDLVASKLTYVEFGTEPAGCMRAVLECWAADQIAGTHDCRDAILRRIGAGRSTHVPAADTWRECIIQPVYDLAVNHYWGSGDAIRQLGELADHVFLLYMVNHTTPAQVFNSLPVISGNVAHVNQFFTSVTADPTSTSSMRVAITLEQAWMQYNHARRGQFMMELARYGSCALAAPDIDMNLVMPHVPDLLALPPAAAQLKLALLAARHAPVASPPPSPLPAHIAFLRGLLGVGPTFPAAAGIGAALGPLGSEEDILAAIGRPLAGAPDPTRPPNANINLGRADVPDQNEFAVTPLRSNGVVATARDDLMVRSRPTTSTNANIFARLPTGTPVLVIGEFGNWYVIEQPGRTGFVAKRYITLVP